jgi:hypothetical protein
MATGSLTRHQNRWSLIIEYWGDLATGECRAQLIGVGRTVMPCATRHRDQIAPYRHTGKPTNIIHQQACLTS